MADKVGFVGLDVGTKAAFGHTQVARAELAGAESHLVTVQGQAGFGAQGVAGAQADAA